MAGIKVEALPGKTIDFVLEKLEKVDHYNCKDFHTIILHLGTVNILRIFDANSSTSPEKVFEKAEELYHKIREHNKFALIQFSGIIPIPKFPQHTNFIIAYNKKLLNFTQKHHNSLYLPTGKLFLSKGLPKLELYKPFPDLIHPLDCEVKRLNSWFGQAITPITVKQRFEAKKSTHQNRQ